VIRGKEKLSFRVGFQLKSKKKMSTVLGGQKGERVDSTDGMDFGRYQEGGFAGKGGRRVVQRRAAVEGTTQSATRMGGERQKGERKVLMYCSGEEAVLVEKEGQVLESGT